MNNKLEVLEFKKLFQEYNYLVSDDLYKKELIFVAQKEFLTKVRELKGEETSPMPAAPTQGAVAEKILLEITEELKIKIKKVYREIVKITHPDKSGSSQHKEIYITATKAIEEHNLFELYNICLELGILYSIDREDKEVLTTHINQKKTKLKEIESSFIWLYINAKTEEEAMQIIQLFIQQTSP